MYGTDGIYYERLEEELNSLLRDQKIRKLRMAPVEYVEKLLRGRMELRLKEAGFDEAMENGFLQKDPEKTKALYALFSNRELGLAISQKQMRELKRCAKQNPKSALAYLLDIQLEEEKLRFRKQIQLQAKVWLSFLNGTVATGEATKEKIQKGLQMTPAQQAEFEKLLITRSFLVDKALRQVVHELLEKTGMILADFQIYAFIGKEAWEPFALPKNDSDKKKKTSQGTLLKLVIGFGLEEEGAWDFMEQAQSVFVEYRDLVFLACIRSRYVNPIQVQEILEFFAQDGEGNRIYTNPYG